MIQPIRIALLIVALVAVGLLSGCKTPPQQTRVVSVAVPVKCKADKPERPVMPTEGPYLKSLPADKMLDAFVQAATAEIELREGYEGKLVAALDSCF